MKKTREPLDRSDVISIISLVVALFGAVSSGIFAAGAQQTAERANLISIEANKLASESNQAHITVSDAYVYGYLSMQRCAYAEEGLSETRLYGWASTNPHLILTNKGGRAAALTEIEFYLRPTAPRAGVSDIRYNFYLNGLGGIVEKGSSTEVPLQIALEIAPGASRILGLTGAGILRGDSETAPDNTRPTLGGTREASLSIEKIDLAATTEYEGVWVLQFNNNQSERVSRTMKATEVAHPGEL
jgi:hypothetical protein